MTKSHKQYHTASFLFKTANDIEEFHFCHYANIKRCASPRNSYLHQSHNVGQGWYLKRLYLKSWEFWKHNDTFRGDMSNTLDQVRGKKGKKVIQIHELAFCHCSQIPEIINLQRERVYFGSLFGRVQSMNNWPCCLGPVVASHDRAKTSHYCQRAKEKRKGQVGLSSPKSQPQWSEASH